MMTSSDEFMLTAIIIIIIIIIIKRGRPWKAEREWLDIVSNEMTNYVTFTFLLIIFMMQNNC